MIIDGAELSTVNCLVTLVLELPATSVQVIYQLCSLSVRPEIFSVVVDPELMEEFELLKI